MEKENTRNAVKVLWEGVRDEPWGPAWFSQFHEMLRRPPRAPIFLQSATVSAVSNFEVLLSGLAAAFYYVAPEALEAASRDKGKEFSLRELKELSSVDEAINISISRRVDELMFGSFNDWRKFFQEKMNLKFQDYSIDWDFLQEVFQRRHVIVHNGGVASRRYIQNVSGKLKEGVEEGDFLEVDEEYLHEATNALLCFGFLLTSAMCSKFAKGHKEDALQSLHNFTYKNLVRGRYEVVTKCATYGISASSNMDDELIFRINGWIARQRSGDGSFRKEVEEWDVRALSTRYSLAKNCLLERKEEAFKELSSLCKTEELNLEALIEWPLLEPLRGLPEYQELIRNIDTPEDWRINEQVLFENPKTLTLHSGNCPLVRPTFKRRSAIQINPDKSALCKRCKPSLVVELDESLD
ncbi:hypothetical protein ACWDUX_29810 [Streptomyces sp. NPDC003444]